MNKTHLDVIIVGGGHAGLSVSYCLKQHGLEHIVFERGKTGQSWRSQRWDSFRFNTANKLNVLAGDQYKGIDPDGFCTAKEYISSLEKYVSTFQLPVVENATVISIDKNEAQGLFNVTVSQNKIIHQYQCRQVIIASGVANEKRVPLFADKISHDIKQLHTAGYRNPSQLPGGAVLVTGSAQSGVQITEDLANAGRKVFLSTSMVARIPRYYRGKDCMDWLNNMSFFDMRADDIKDPVMLNMKPPHLTGTGGRRTISLQALAKKGVTILGKMENAKEKNVFFQSNAAMHVKFADGFSANVKAMIDEFIEKNQLTAPSPEFDKEDMPDTNADCASSITSLNLEENNIRSIIWTTGFGVNFDYIKLPVLDNEGNPVHTDGSSSAEGLYFIGLPWLRSRKSAVIFGLKEDAEFIADKVFSHARHRKGMYAATN